MDVNSLHKTVTRQRRGCDLNPGASAPESSTLTARLPSHPITPTLYLFLFRDKAMIESSPCDAPCEIDLGAFRATKRGQCQHIAVPYGETVGDGGCRFGGPGVSLDPTSTQLPAPSNSRALSDFI